MSRYDLIVIGGGPAGIMAAGQATEQGLSTLLLEKKSQLGRKLSITGKGRCNLTNIASLPDFLDHFGKNGRFLRQPFNRFFSPDLASFLADLGVDIKTERGGRVFPADDNAPAVTKALVRWIHTVGVTVISGLSVDKLLVKDNRIAGVRANNREFFARRVIIATGGLSYPATGSTGDGYLLAQSVGHQVIPTRPALVPLETAGKVAQSLQGLSLRNIRVRVEVDSSSGESGAEGASRGKGKGKKQKGQKEQFGEMIFTHFGISGPIILTISRQVVDALQMRKRVFLTLDLKPALDEKKLDARLLRDIQEHGKKKFQTLLGGLLPSKLVPVCCQLTRISPDKISNQISGDERRRLLDWLKCFRLEIKRHRSYNEAIVTAGGVSTQEINPRTMESKLISGLYFAGELLDVDGETGGYNLQAAFSTGWLAGHSAAEQA